MNKFTSKSNLRSVLPLIADAIVALEEISFYSSFFFIISIEKFAKSEGLNH
jgi:ribonucleotide reductase beta subunit family protein with ferritin-like domain